MIRKLGARYELQEPIGGGGMAVVYRAVDTLLDRTVAVKMLRPQYAGDDEFVARFRQEAQSAARLSHPNIVNLYDIGVSNNEYYLVMEFVDGMTLKDVIRQSAPMEIEDVVDICTQICDALEHAHNRQIIHRDVKPHNILLTKSGQAKVTDFGIARAITGNTITYQQATSVLGSVHYFSPEQARGAAADVKSDIYSLGVVMYEMLTDKLPFSGDTPVSVALKHLQERFVEPREMFPEIPQSVENIVLRCLVKDPDERYPDMKAVKADLNTCLDHPDVPKFVMPVPDVIEDATISLPAVGGGQLSSKQDSVAPEPAKPKRRRAVKILVGTVVSLCVLIAAAVVAYYIEFYLVGREQTLVMPNVTGRTEQQAVLALEASGFTQHNIIEERAYNPHPAGEVYNQDPKSQTSVKQSRSVYLYVSRGPQQIQMPDLQNFSLDQAEQELENRGFTASNIHVTHVSSDEFDAGTVVDSSPQAGSMVSVNQSVTLTVSQGRQFIVPIGIIGMNVVEVKQLILTEGLTIGQVYMQPSPGNANGTVFKTSPASGQIVSKGTAVTIYVADNGTASSTGGDNTGGLGSGNDTSTGAGGATSGDTGSGGGTATGNGGATGNSSEGNTTSSGATGASPTGTGSGTTTVVAGGAAPSGSTAGDTGTTSSGTGTGTTRGNTTTGNTGGGAADGSGGTTGSTGEQGAGQTQSAGGNSDGGAASSAPTMVPLQVTVTDAGGDHLPVEIRVQDAKSPKPRVYLTTSIQSTESWTVPVYVTAQVSGEVIVYVNGKVIDRYPVSSPS